MARRRKPPAQKETHGASRAGAAQAGTSQGDPRYGMALSRQRLEREGLHPKASSQRRPHEIVDAWATMASKHMNRPHLPANWRRMTRAFLLLREQPREADSLAKVALAEVALGEFETLITAQSVGPRIIDHVFATGHKSALNLAMASRRLWNVLAASVNYFDFYAGRLQNLGPSGVFVSVTPEFTLQEMMATRLTDPYGFKSATPFTDWHNAAITREEDAVNSLFMVRRRLSAEAKKKPINEEAQPIPAFLGKIFDQATLKAILALKDIDGIFKANQFISLPAHTVFEPQMIYAATRLQLLLIQIYNQRKNTQVLHFHQTPFFDRRVLAIVLRACPNVTMLGVYNCPLIHFGDMIPIIDLIYEINQERKLTDAPCIEAFDFYPSFHQGLTVPEGQSPIYGLTPDSMDLDIVQRGVYAILLKVFLKSRHMRLNLLFEPGRALKAFLFRLPNPPLSIASFFDGLYRFLDGAASLVQRREALYDLTKPIRLGIEQNLNDDESWYREEMGRYLPFCSSCGYEMLYELFPTGARRVYPHRRICAGCSLQDLLDRQPHNMRDWKIGMLAKIMPDWEGKTFNKDAPTGRQTCPSSDLMWLQATASSREEMPPLYVQEDGQLAATSRVIQLVRDNKYTTDSLQNLPSLYDLAEDATFDNRWAELFNRCNEADIYARARRRLLAESRVEKPSKSPRDSNGEVWHRPKHAREVQSFNYVSAAQFHAALEAKGW